MDWQNTDGCQMAKSSKSSAWPVYLKIVDLPPDIRDEHMILAALYVRQEKPVMNAFMYPIVTEELNPLSEEGVEWINGKVKILSKFVPLGFILDLPARCSICNMKQYNGKFGCTYCYHPSESVNDNAKYPISNKVHELRTHDKIVKDMIAAEKSNCEVRGVRGPSTLMLLKNLNLGNMIPPDSMHFLYLGIVPQHTDLLLTSHKEPYYIGSPNCQHIINNNLLSCKPPRRITRSPRPITDRANWKASEWRSWLLFYSLPCLQNVLPEKYWKHWAKLVAVAQILSSNSISKKDLEEANTLIIEYTVEFQQIFGKQHMTYNLHLLLHVIRSVRMFGPIQGYDAFSFENENRLLLKLKTSPTEVTVQIAKRYMFYRSIPLFSTYFHKRLFTLS